MSIDIPPIYDGNEPIYKFKRKWDLYIENKINKEKYNNVLNCINCIFKTDYKNLLSIKDIHEKTIPPLKKIIKIINNDFKNYFDIKNNSSSFEIINSILHTLSYSFVSSTKENMLYYRIKYNMQPDSE